MARKGAAGRKRGRCFSSTSSSSIANKIVRNYCDYGKLIYSRIGRGIAFAIRKWKTVRPSQSDLSWYDFYVCATEFDVMSSWDLWFCTVNTQPFAVGTRGVYRKRYGDKYCLGRALGVGPFCTTWRKILRLVLLHVATITFQSQRLK